MNLYQILSMDERILVYSSEEDQCFYTWNGSATLQRWNARVNKYMFDYPSPGEWEEADIRTISYETMDYHMAREKAIAWHTGS